MFRRTTQAKNGYKWILAANLQAGRLNILCFWTLLHISGFIDLGCGFIYFTPEPISVVNKILWSPQPIFNLNCKSISFELKIFIYKCRFECLLSYYKSLFNIYFGGEKMSYAIWYCGFECFLLSTGNLIFNFWNTLNINTISKRKHWASCAWPNKYMF